MFTENDVKDRADDGMRRGGSRVDISRGRSRGNYKL